MIWLIALACMGGVGMIGFRQGPIRAGFSLLGLLFGAMLAGPLSPLAARLLPLAGLHHPVWGVFVPQGIAFVLILIVFMVVGNVLHTKVSVHYKYKETEAKLLAWERMYSRLGFCIGLANGMVYFFLLMMPIYVGGYFTREAAAGATGPAGIQFVNRARGELHEVNLDRVLAGYDPMPDTAYLAGDIVSTVLHNPALHDRLSHYPPLLVLGERKEFQELEADTNLQQMIQNQARPADILALPSVKAIVTNAEITRDISEMLEKDLPDLRDYLNTGASQKYGEEKILGLWSIDVRGTVTQEKRRNPNLNPVQLMKTRADLLPEIRGLSLTAMIDNNVILMMTDANTGLATVVAQGTWEKKGGGYMIHLPNSKPSTAEMTFEDDDTLMFPKDSHELVFRREK